MSAVVSERREAVQILTINRPAAFNALNAEVIEGLRDGIGEAVAMPSVRAVIVTGAGEKAFCAGADLKELDGLDQARAEEKLRAGQDVFRLIEGADVPVIAAVNGLALGGGFELALACSFTLVSKTASFGLPEAGLGLIPGYGGTQRLPRLVGKAVATHLMATGSRWSADDAHVHGLTPLPPFESLELLEEATAIASTIAAQGPGAVQSILRLVQASQRLTLDDGLALETALAAQALVGDESTEGIGAFLAKRPARFADMQDRDGDVRE